MRSARRLTVTGLVLLGALAFGVAPALAAEGLGVTGEFGGSGSGPGELSLVYKSGDVGSGLAVSSTGDVYVADTGNNRVEWFTVNTGTKKYEYGGQFNGGGQLANENGKAAPQPLSEPEGIAVDNDPASPSKGDVYVVGDGGNVVDKFSATGEFLFQLPAEEGVSGIAIDPSGDVWVVTRSVATVQEFGDEADNTLKSSLPVGGFAFAFAVDSEDNFYISDGGIQKYDKEGTVGGSVCSSESCQGDLVIDAANNDLLVDPQGTSVTEYGPFGEPFEALVETSKPGIFEGGAGIAVDSTTHEVFVADAAKNDILILTSGPAPGTPETLAATEERQASAVLHGKLPSSATELEYYFEYNTGSSCTEGKKTPVKKGTGAVSEEVTKLQPNAEYTYCVFVENNFGVSESGGPASFNTLPAPPKIISETAFNEEHKAGVFEAEINPDNQETTYFFEYSLEGKTGAGEELKGEIETAPGEASLPPTFEELPVKVHVQPIQVTDTYYYRVVAENTKGEKSTGKVEAYTKLPLITEESSSALTSTSVHLTANVNPDFQETNYLFEYSTSKTELEHRKGIQIQGGSGAIPANELSLVARCHNGNPPNPEGAAYVCEDGTQPTCEEGVPTPHGKTLICQITVDAEIVSLQPGEIYYYRVVAENETSRSTENANGGLPALGETESLKTFAGPEAETTIGAQSVTQTSATLFGTVNPEGAETTYSFQYIGAVAYQAALGKGATDPYAEGEATSPVSAGSGTTAEAIGPILASGLKPSETYHYRLVATNRYGVQGIGQEATFTTLSASLPLVSTGGASGVSQDAATLSGTVTTNGLQTNYGFEIATEPFQPGTHVPATGLGSIGGAVTETVSSRLSKLAPGTAYYYRITATNADGTVQGEPQVFTTPGFPSLISIPTARAPLASLNIVFPKEEKVTTGTTIKALTNKQKLAKALKQCKKDHSKTRRQACEKAAKRKYGGAQSKKKGKAKK